MLASPKTCDLKSHRRVTFNNPDRWRDRAKEARANAEQMAEVKAASSMLEAARQYENLAELAELLLSDDEADRAHRPKAPLPR